MKKLSLFIGFLLAFSCEHSKGRHPYTNYILIGKWRIYETSSVTKNSEGTSTEDNILCNACPEITFQTNDTGFIKRFDPKILSFHWTVEGDKLTLKNYITGDNVLNSGVYKMKAGKGTTLSLFDSLRNVTYKLGKDIE